MSFTYNKLRGRIIEKFSTLEAFANALGVSRVTVSSKLNGSSSFSQDNIVAWSELLGIDVSEYGNYFFN